MYPQYDSLLGLILLRLQLFSDVFMSIHIQTIIIFLIVITYINTLSAELRFLNVYINYCIDEISHFRYF